LAPSDANLPSREEENLIGMKSDFSLKNGFRVKRIFDIGLLHL